VTPKRISILRVALVVVGITCLALGPLMLVWPTGWRWSPHHAHYEQMIVGLYLTLGVFLIRASKDPLQHLSIIWFAVWSSIAHASIMLIQSFSAPEHHGHLVADVPALFLAAAILSYLTPRRPPIGPSLGVQGA
jgi:hypothetical protein